MQILKKISFVIPTLNEAGTIGPGLQALQTYRRKGHEVIVVDGGSTDDTRLQAEPLADQVLEAARGRAAQMNAGAQIASGEVLMFLHADTYLSDNADEGVLSALQGGAKRWGWCRVHLDNPAWPFRIIERLMAWRARCTRVCTGDQAQFVTKDLFRKLGGFPALPLMEDVALSKLLRASGAPACAEVTATTSARRWETNGILRTVLLMWWLRWLYFIGVSPSALLEKYYPQTRPEPAKPATFEFPAACIAVFARPPVPGKVKTRLLPALGPQRATALYEAMLHRCLETLGQATLAPLDLWVADNSEHAGLTSFSTVADIHVQTGADLGERMMHTMTEVLSRPRTEAVLFLGTDCPAMDAAYVRMALSALASGIDAVLGPAEDGGYVLLGLGGSHPELFRDIPWGTERVAERTRARIHQLGLSYLELNTMWDVDVADDLPRLAQLDPPLAW